MNSVIRACGLLAISLTVVGAICHHYPYCSECPLSNGFPKCIKCQSKLFALDTSQDPPPCVYCKSKRGCTLCSNLTKCELCERYDHGPDSEGEGTCSPCPDGCSKCRTDSKICDECASGYVLVDGQCQSCPAYCRECNAAKVCHYCNQGFLLESDGSCSVCIENCAACSDTSTCNRCFNGYFVAPDKKSCSACTVSNCKTCFDDKTCDACLEGFYLKNDKTCQSCKTNCKSCDNKGKCLRCKFGKISAQGSCECAPNCADCNSSGYGNCDKCQPGFKKTKDRQCVDNRDGDNNNP